MKNPPSACSSLGLKSEENYVDYRYTYSKKQGMTALTDISKKNRFQAVRMYMKYDIIDEI